MVRAGEMVREETWVVVGVRDKISRESVSRKRERGGGMRLLT